MWHKVHRPSVRPTAGRAHQPSPTPSDEAAAEPEPEHVGFECHLCQTRMYARVKDVGKKMKCPDCHSLTVIPPPPPPKKKNIPAALEGEQYELWEPDASPIAAELVAQQPRYIAVTCTKCSTLMYCSRIRSASRSNVPIAANRNVVPPPRKPKPKVSVLAPDALTPKLDPAADPGDRPPVEISPRKKMVHEERAGSRLRSSAWKNPAAPASRWKSIPAAGGSCRGGRC